MNFSTIPCFKKRVLSAYYFLNCLLTHRIFTKLHRSTSTNRSFRSWWTVRNGHDDSGELSQSAGRSFPGKSHARMHAFDGCPLLWQRFGCRNKQNMCYKATVWTILSPWWHAQVDGCLPSTSLRLTMLSSSCGMWLTLKIWLFNLIHSPTLHFHCNGVGAQAVYSKRFRGFWSSRYIFNRKPHYKYEHSWWRL